MKWVPYRFGSMKKYIWNVPVKLEYFMNVYVHMDYSKQNSGVLYASFRFGITVNLVKTN